MHQPFTVYVADEALADLAMRLERARLPHSSDRSWDGGTSPWFLARLVEHWRTQYDWRAQERDINQFAHYRSRMSGMNIHYIHERGRGPSPLPLILTHGYPDSFLRFHKIIPLLTDPGAHGGAESDAFDVVVPSLPGFAFSDAFRRDGGIFHVGALWHELMTKELHYDKFGAHGGDWGSTVSEHLARSYPASLVGVHLTDVPFWHAFRVPGDATQEEREHVARTQRYMEQQGAYAMIQGTRPFTLAHGLLDSPAGMAAWLVEKFCTLSDCNGDVESRFTLDELITNVMIYWVTRSIGTAFTPYFDFTNAGALRFMLEKAKELAGGTRVPAGFAIFAKDTAQPPRSWADRFFDVRRFTRIPVGGHFAAAEEPELLARELRAFFRPLRAATRRTQEATDPAAAAVGYS
ncbi:MAG TPA: epoxide hydrolase [Polyangiaceae bacterium]|jgi:microsomal epoxide hydrolase